MEILDFGQRDNVNVLASHAHLHSSPPTVFSPNVTSVASGKSDNVLGTMVVYRSLVIYFTAEGNPEDHIWETL